MSNPDDEKGGSQVVPDRPDGTAGEPAPANRESAERRDAEHDDDGHSAPDKQDS